MLEEMPICIQQDSFVWVVSNVAAGPFGKQHLSLFALVVIGGCMTIFLKAKAGGGGELYFLVGCKMYI